MKRKASIANRLTCIILALIMAVALLPISALAIEPAPSTGVFVRDADSSFFDMSGESRNGQVIAGFGWRYDEYFYFSLDVHKNTSIDPLAFKINGIPVGEDNYWKLPEETPLQLYNGSQATEPDLVETLKSTKVWLIGRIPLVDSGLELSFENLHHSPGWAVDGISLEGDLFVTHQYGKDANAIVDFDQSVMNLTVGTDLSIHPVPDTENDYVYASVTCKLGDTVIEEGDYASYGIIKNGDGTLRFTATDALTSDTFYVEYLYIQPMLEITKIIKTGENTSIDSTISSRYSLACYISDADEVKDSQTVYIREFEKNADGDWIGSVTTTMPLGNYYVSENTEPYTPDSAVINGVALACNFEPTDPTGGDCALVSVTADNDSSNPATVTITNIYTEIIPSTLTITKTFEGLPEGQFPADFALGVFEAAAEEETPDSPPARDAKRAPAEEVKSAMPKPVAVVTYSTAGGFITETGTVTPTDEGDGFIWTMKELAQGVYYMDGNTKVDGYH